MKNNTFLAALKMLFGIDIILGVIAVSVLGTFILWFLNGGVILLPIFISLPIYVLIFIIAFFVLGIKFGYKAVWIIMLSFPLGWLGYSHIYKITCGPNAQDVKVMKPMAKAISGYIVKNGIPASLSNIPNLPYELQDCKRDEYYSGIYSKKVPKNKAIGYDIDIKCKTKRGITVKLGLFMDYEDNTTYLGINFESTNGTKYGILMQKKANETVYDIEEDKPYKINFESICRNPMKQ